MELGIAGRTAFVVGGSGLLGRAVATALRSEGARVVLGARDRSRLSEAARGLSFRTLDTLDEGSVRAAVEQIGDIDILVNAAAPRAQTLNMARDRDPGQVVAEFEAKAMGYLRVMNAVLPGMRDRGFGRVVNISGQGAHVTLSVTGAVRNQAVITVSKVLADEYAGSGVTVNVVNPGVVVTGAPSTAIAPGSPGESTPAQVAAVVTFLCSAAAGGVSGESVAVGHRVRGVQ
ncbi:SDR family NAD(P)-dependent oxidoreductase [Actinoplanes sp. NPDC000266]